jgi:hypothetical protein
MMILLKVPVIEGAMSFYTRCGHVNTSLFDEGFGYGGVAGQNFRFT